MTTFEEIKAQHEKDEALPWPQSPSGKWLMHAHRGRLIAEVERLLALFRTDGEMHAKAMKDQRDKDQHRLGVYVEHMNKMTADINKLDAVCRVLGIEETEIPPAEKAEELLQNLEAERAKVATLREVVKEFMLIKWPPMLPDWRKPVTEQSRLIPIADVHARATKALAETEST